MGTGCPIIDALELGSDDPGLCACVLDRVSFVVSFPFLFAIESGVLGIVLRY
jgi:hypothetical protein